MPANYQELLVSLLMLCSGLELAACLIFSRVDARNRKSGQNKFDPMFDAGDPFEPWVNMLDRQSDRRNTSRYGGVERRLKIRYSLVSSK